MGHVMGLSSNFGQDGPSPADAAPELGSKPVVVTGTASGATNGAWIEQGLVFRGTIRGAASLYVDGEIVGNIDLPESRVTVGPHGRVSDGLSVCINAREIVVMGKIRGNISASDLVEIRAEGSVTGNVSARRIRIEDGAYFKGDISLRAAPAKPVTAVAAEEEPEVRVYA